MPPIYGEIGCFTNIIHFFEAFQVMDDVAEQLQLSYSFFGVQGGAPPSYKWVIIPVTIDISPINHSYWTYLHQLS